MIRIQLTAIVLGALLIVGLSGTVAAQSRGLGGGLLGAGIGGALGGSSGALAGAAIGGGVGLMSDRHEAEKQQAAATSARRDEEMLRLQMERLELERQLLEAERRALEAERAAQ